MIVHYINDIIFVEDDVAQVESLDVDIKQEAKNEQQSCSKSKRKRKKSFDENFLFGKPEKLPKIVKKQK